MGLSAFIVLSSMALGVQTPPAKAPAAAVQQPAAQPQAAPKPTVPAPAAPNPAPAQPSAAAPAPPPAPPAAATPPPAPEAFTYQPAGRRDPFLNLLGTGVEPRNTGKHGDGASGMTVAEISVRGVLQSRGALVAMVTGPD